MAGGGAGGGADGRAGAERLVYPAIAANSCSIVLLSFLINKTFMTDLTTAATAAVDKP